jgi:UDP:flavonoid glycosyltransferase YjiC (YdhE family)
MSSIVSKKKAFIAPLNWGLGHATRILPLIKYLQAKNYSIYIGAAGRSKEVLQKELHDCTFVEFPKYPIKYPHSRFFVTRFMLIIFPQMLIAMNREKRRLKKLHSLYNFDLIISDNRFSAALKSVKSILVSHQLRYKLPWPVQKMEWLPEYFNFTHFRKYDKIVVPDIERGNTFTGELSHQMRFIPTEKLFYSGILTDLVHGNKTSSNTIDYFVIISGPEPQRTKFEKLIFNQLQKLDGRVVVTLGKPEKNYKIRMGDAQIYTYLNREKISYFMGKADFIISRPGYTTVMEMIDLGKRGLFIPTPGQIEQEYLAKHFSEMNWCYSSSQYKLDLTEDIRIARTYSGFPDNFSQTSENLDKLYRDVIER